MDVLTKSRHVSELNAPAVIMEMKIDKSDKVRGGVFMFL